MEKAKKVLDLVRSFDNNPLVQSDLSSFFVDTTEARIGDIAEDPIEDIIDRFCQAPDEPCHALFMGHVGSGKTTALRELVTKLQDIRECTPLVTITSVRDKLDLFGMTHVDLIIMIMTELARAASEGGVKIKSSLIKSIRTFWDETQTEYLENRFKTELSAEAEAGISHENWFFKLMAKVQSTLAVESETRKNFEIVYKPRLSEFVTIVNDLATEISSAWAEKNYLPQKVLPVVILDDLDKIDISRAIDIFLHNGGIFPNLRMRIIYTFPIEMQYRSEYAGIKRYFPSQWKYPAIKLYKWSQEKEQPFIKNQSGWDAMYEIVRRRAADGLIDADALELFIRMSGGYLRTLFDAITRAALRANRRGAGSVMLEDAQRALEYLKADIGHVLSDGRLYPVIRKVYNGYRQFKSDESYESESANDPEKVNPERIYLNQMLASNVLLEYNTKGWVDLHPLAKAFLEENHLLEKAD